MLLRQLFDKETSTYTYLVADPKTHEAVLIDPVLEQVERDLKLLSELGLSLCYVLDTHVHADHVTASGELRRRTGAQTAQAKSGAACADVHLLGGEQLRVGELTIDVLATPGHTDDSLSYRISDHVFTGDALLVRGTGRTDFQNGDAGQLYDSLTKVLFALPEHVTVWPGHDYRGHTQSSIGEEQRFNPRVAGKTREQFVDIMNGLGLPRPAHIDRAVPANRQCGVALVNQAEPPAVQDIAPGDLKHLHGRARLIDVREPDEFRGDLGHIEGAELVPLASVEAAASEWDRSQPLVMICRSGRRSLTAGNNLVRMGFQQVMNLKGGMIAYRAESAA